MATYVLTDAQVSVATVDLTAWTKSVTVKLDKAAVDDTNMGDTTNINLGGLKSWSVSIACSQDHTDEDGPDTTMWTIFDSAEGTAELIIVPTSDEVSATNPSFTGTGLLTSYPAISGSVGAKSEVTYEFVPAGDMERATSPPA